MAPAPPGTPEADPLEHGFDSNVAGSFIGRPASYFADASGSFGMFGLGPGSSIPAEYLTDRLTVSAVDFIEENARADHPFFLYVSHFAVHVPLEAPAALVAKYEAKAPAGGHANAVYAAMIESLDASLGRILDALEAEGIRDNTIVVFASDNGGLLAVTSSAPLRGGKASADPATPQEVDGLSFLAALEGGAAQGEALFWHYPHVASLGGPERGSRFVSAVVWRNWKLVYFFEDESWELYNLDRDLEETVNLIEDRPGVAAWLGRWLVDWLIETDAQLPILRSNAPQAVPLPVPPRAPRTRHRRF